MGQNKKDKKSPKIRKKDEKRPAVREVKNNLQDQTIKGKESHLFNHSFIFVTKNSENILSD